MSRCFSRCRRRSGSFASRVFSSNIFPFHGLLGCDIQHWNRCLREEINELIAFYDPAVLVFDGSVPYQGMVEALGDNPDVWAVWCRRGMWQADRGKEAIAREHHFDAVVEPRELAGRFDQGLTAQSRSRTRVVGSIRLLDEGNLLSRRKARAALGIDAARPAVLLQLVYRLIACIDRLLAPGERRRIARRCAMLERRNGAVEFAGLIEEMAYSRKVDRA